MGGETSSRASGRAQGVVREAADALDADCAEVGRADLTKARLLRFRKALEASTALEAEREESLEKHCRDRREGLEKELDDAVGRSLVVEGAELASARIDQAQARLQVLKDEKAARLAKRCRWARTHPGCGSGCDSRTRMAIEFRDAVKHGGLRRDVRVRREGAASLRAELCPSRCW